jgi:hypothetical protein
MPRYPYRDVGTSLGRNFRNDLNANFDDIEADLRDIQNDLNVKYNTTRDRMTQIENDSIERDNDLDARIDNLILSAGDSSPEVADARYDSVKNVTYPTLKDRLDDLSVRMNDKINFTNDNANSLLIAPFFRSNSDTNVYLYASSDGIKFKKLSDKPLFQARDSSIFYKDGYFYIAYTSYNPHDFSIKRSQNLKDWETFNISVGLFADNGVNDKIWAPEWFEDDDGKIYIILSRKVGMENDITSTNIPSFRPYMVECTDLTNLTFGTPFELNLENTNKIDGFIIKVDGVYHLFIKDEYDKKIEIWTSTDLTTWTKQTDDVDVFNGDFVEAPCITYFNGTYYLYVDKYSEGFTYVSTSTDLVTFTPAVPIQIKDVNRHATILEVSDRQAKVILNDYINSNTPTENNYAKTVNLGTLATAGVIDTLTPREGILYYSGAADGDLTINSIVNSYNIKKFFVSLRSGSTGSITIKSGGDLEIQSTGLIISPSLGNADTVYEFNWVESLGKFKVKGIFPNKLLQNKKIITGYKRIDLNTLGPSGTNFTNFAPDDGALYVATGSETYTISGIVDGMPDGTRFYVGLFSNIGTAKITLQSGTNLIVPGGSFVIDVASGRNDMIFEIVKCAGTSFRLKW